MSVYWIIVIIVLSLGLIIPEKDIKSRKILIFLLFSVHLFVCGFKYQSLTGDLIAYQQGFKSLADIKFFSAETLNNGRNPLWTVFEKIICDLTNGNINVLIFVHAFIIEFCLAHFVMKYSPKPWFSYLVWDCMSFYLYGFSAMKQALAMALLLIAAEGILEKNKVKFFLFTVLAGLVHLPAIIFIIAYWVSQRKLSFGFALCYFISLVLVFLFRNPIANYLSENYYEDVYFAEVSEITGGRFFVVLMIVGAAFIIKGFKEEHFKTMFILIAIAAIPQLLSVYNNVFTRLTDYYLQLTILYFPLLLTPDKVDSLNYDDSRMGPLVVLNDKSRLLVTIAFTVVLVWWFYMAEMRFETPNVPQTYYNFSFFWEH